MRQLLQHSSVLNSAIRILYASCILHISISTAHNIITLLQSLRGFTTSAITSVPGGSSMYFITPTPLMVTNSILYVVNVSNNSLSRISPYCFFFQVFAQDLLLVSDDPLAEMSK